MSPTSPVALAYSSHDRDLALDLETDLKGILHFRHFSVDDQSESQPLSDTINEFSGYLFLLVSDNFLRNPNCMLHANRLLTSGMREAKAILISSTRYDEQIGETVEVETKLARQSDIMHYINHWQARYLDLRRQRKELEAEIGPQFSEYLTKIGDVSGQVNDFLHYLKDSMPLRWAEFQANHYQQLFLFIEDQRAWREFSSNRTLPTKDEVDEVDEVDITEIPGMDLLAKTAPTVLTDEDELEEVLPPVSAPPTSVEASFEGEEEDDFVEESDREESEDQEENAEAATFIRRAWMLAERGNVKEALDLVESGREAMPESKELHYHHALLLALEANDPASARQQLATLIAVSPDYPDALFLSGELYLAEENYAKAREAWEQVTDIAPNYPELNHQLGLLIADHFPEDAFDAATYLRKATKENSDDAELYFRYALLMASELERPEKAIKLLNKAISLAPRYAEAHYELALLHHQQGEYLDARTAYQRAVQLDASFATPENEQAFILPIRKQPSLMTELESGALSALKENIAQLEKLIHERDHEAQLAAEQAKVESLNNRPGAGKIIFISGATSGIGLATARKFASKGYNLVITGRRMDRLEELQQELVEAHQVKVHSLNFDVRDRAAVANAVDSLPTDWANIDILLNNAGKAKGFDPIHKGDLDHWDEMIDTNLKGLLYLTRAISPRMVERGNGLIINLCSTAGKEVYLNGNVYCATKHAVDALTSAMRLDLVNHGVRVGQVCPAHVEETEFALVRFDGDAQRAEKVYENFQPLTSTDVAETIYFMAAQPAHVNILDVVLQGKQQASSSYIDRSGRLAQEEE